MITQPDNTTAHMGETVMFTCVIDTSNANVTAKDISWWREKRDYKNSFLMIPKQDNHKFRIIENETGENLTSILIINDVRSSDAGPYWLRLMDIKNITMAFLSIVPDGMFNCMRA